METKQGYISPQMPFPYDIRFYKADQAEILSIPNGARFIGMEIYAYTEKQWYIFRDGITDGDLIISKRYAHNYGIIHLDPAGGNDANSGLINDPVQTLQHAIDIHESTGYNIKVVASGPLGNGTIPTATFQGTVLRISGYSDVTEGSIVDITDKTEIAILNVTDNRIILEDIKVVTLNITQTGTNKVYIKLLRGKINNFNETIAAAGNASVEVADFSSITPQGIITTPINAHNGSRIVLAFAATLTEVSVGINGYLQTILPAVRTIHTLTAYTGHIEIGTGSSLIVDVVFNHYGTAFQNKSLIDYTSAVEDYVTGQWADATRGHIIEDEGTPLIQRADMNFVGDGVVATDTGGKTVITIPGGAALEDGAGTTANGDAVDLGGDVNQAVDIILKSLSNTFRIGTETGEQPRTSLTFEANETAIVSQEDANEIFSAIGLARAYGISETESVPGIWMRVTNYPTINKTAAIILRNDGIISIGSGLRPSSDFSRMRFNADYSGTWDALTVGERARIVVDWGYIDANKLSDAPSDGSQYARKDGAWVEVVSGGIVRQTLTVTNANYTAALAIPADTTNMKIILDAALTNDWQPSGITGWQEGKQILFEIIKNSDNGVDLTTARAVPNVGYDDDTDPFAVLIDIDTTQKRTVVNATGFKSTFGQFGAMIITDTGYVE